MGYERLGIAGMVTEVPRPSDGAVAARRPRCLGSRHLISLRNALVLEELPAQGG